VRDIEIYARFSNGETTFSLASAHKLSVQRIPRIIWFMAGNQQRQLKAIIHDRLQLLLRVGANNVLINLPKYAQLLI